MSRDERKLSSAEQRAMQLEQLRLEREAYERGEPLDMPEEQAPAPQTIIRQPKPKKVRPPITEEQKRNRMLVLKCTLVILAAVVIGTLSLTVLFPINTIEVQGNERYTVEEITQASAIEQGENLLRANEGKAERLIVDRFPYIESVEVQKKLPSTIVLVIGETRADSRVSTNKGILMLDRNGRVLDIPMVDDGSVVPQVVYCEGMENQVGGYIFDESPDMLALHRLLLTELEANGLVEKVTNITYQDKYDIRLLYGGRIEAKLGNQNDMKAKIAEFAKDVAKLSDSDMGVLNLTLTNLYEVPFTPKNAFAPEEQWWNVDPPIPQPVAPQPVADDAAAQDAAGETGEPQADAGTGEAATETPTTEPSDAATTSGAAVTSSAPVTGTTVKPSTGSGGTVTPGQTLPSSLPVSSSEVPTTG